MEALSKRLTATLLFTVIRDFPRIVNILTLEETHTFLNDCAEIVIEAASKYHGSVANYIGDELRFLFAIPLPNSTMPSTLSNVHCRFKIQLMK